MSDNSSEVQTISKKIKIKINKKKNTNSRE